MQSARLIQSIKSPGLVLIRAREYKWVNNMLKVAGSNPAIKDEITKWTPFHEISNKIGCHPRIEKDGHSGGTMVWTIFMAQVVLMTKAKIRKHKLGFSYI